MSLENTDTPKQEVKEDPKSLVIRYTEKIENRLKNTYFAELNKSGLKPYTYEGNALRKEYPIQFCYVFHDHGDPKWKEYFAYFKTSIEQIYPDCGLSTVEYQVNKNDFIAARCQAYAKLRRELRGNLIFLDTDIICFNRCDPFVEDFDIGLTDSVKTWPLMPFNGGVRFVKDTPAAQLYMDKVMELACDRAQGLQDWWVDQLAMKAAYDQLKDQVKFKIFPHELYNFAPEGAQATEAYFIHCKGDRKDLMRQYLACVLGTDHFSFTIK